MVALRKTASRPKAKPKAKKAPRKKAPPISRGPDAREMRKYQAEGMVTDAMKATPAFKRAVTQTEKALEGVAATASKAIQKGKG